MQVQHKDNRISLYDVAAYGPVQADDLAEPLSILLLIVLHEGIGEMSLAKDITQMFIGAVEIVNYEMYILL